MNKYISFLLLCGFLMIFDNLQGQDSSNQVIDTTIISTKRTKETKVLSNATLASQAKNQLREGALIVLLRSEHKRIYQLEILSRSSEYSTKQQANILKKIAAIKEEAQLKNEALIEGFRTKYRFSDFYFAYDTSLVSIQKGTQKGIFVNNAQEIDETITMKAKHIYLCRYGLISTSQQKEGLLITDIKGERIPRPFPSVAVARASGLLLILNLVTNDGTYTKKSIARDVERLELNIRNLRFSNKK